MSLSKRRAAAVAAVVLCAALSPLALGQAPPARRPASREAASIRNTYRPLPAELPAGGGDHPLAAVIDYARKEQRYLAQTVRDFSCRLVKRERIRGVLQELHFIDVQVREHADDGRTLLQPLSIYLHFLAPRVVVGRKVLYVEGQNDGKLLVRNGGSRFEYVVVEIDPQGENARDETLVPITDVGFSRLLDQMIHVLERHQQADPAGTNTNAERISGAKLNDRLCTVIRVTHPQRATGLEFHQAHVFVDDALHVPVRVDYSDWPRQAGEPAPLIAEYTYTDLRLNVNLPDAAFDRARLRSRAD